MASSTPSALGTLRLFILPHSREQWCWGFIVTKNKSQNIAPHNTRLRNSVFEFTFAETYLTNSVDTRAGRGNAWVVCQMLAAAVSGDGTCEGVSVWGGRQDVLARFQKTNEDGNLRVSASADSERARDPAETLDSFRGGGSISSFYGFIFWLTTVMWTIEWHLAPSQRGANLTLSGSQSFSSPKGNPFPIKQSLPVPSSPSPWLTLTCFLSVYVHPLWMFPRNGITQSVNLMFICFFFMFRVHPCCSMCQCFVAFDSLFSVPPSQLGLLATLGTAERTLPSFCAILSASGALGDSALPLFTGFPWPSCWSGSPDLPGLCQTGSSTETCPLWVTLLIFEILILI